MQMRGPGSQSVRGDSARKSVTPGPVFISYNQSWLFVVDVLISDSALSL